MCLISGCKGMFLFETHKHFTNYFSKEFVVSGSRKWFGHAVSTVCPSGTNGMGTPFFAYGHAVRLAPMFCRAVLLFRVVFLPVSSNIIGVKVGSEWPCGV